MNTWSLWLFVAFVSICSLGYGVGVKIERRIRTRHPTVWRDLGFPSNTSPFQVPAKLEGDYARAQAKLFRLIWKKEGIFLSDPTLIFLRRIQIVVSVAAIFVLLLLLLKPGN